MNAQQAATYLFESVWGSCGLPVDPVLVARSLGIDVVETRLPENVSGAIIKDKDKDPVILLCKTDSNSRKRSTCAHEIGHYAYCSIYDVDHYEYVDLRGNSSGAGFGPEEIYANQFASELLMPSQEVYRFAQYGLPTFLIAQNFGVPDDAIKSRLRGLGLSIG